ncbi:NAD(P)/FAD-dependent oxidoreductase [Ferrovibrio sp.]|uniref:FAD-dependent oxidoreductase n=1 Tax=Ferrovibrio sp. TaxID=1917215 RepID=UPI002608066B|nr:NAD(P)/FAD-dependent oxidoreductase [Ferrovibrio sp.]
MTSNRTAEVAGAGIAGLAVSIALAQRGWKVRAYERSPSLRPDGAGIYIWENGLRVLASLGAHDEAVEGCHRGFMRETRDDQNRTVAAAHFAKMPNLRVVSITRMKLLTALSNRARELGVEVVFGTEAVSATPDGEIRLSTGEIRKADLVVGADGINSKIRDSVNLLRKRTPLADGAIRVMIPRRMDERVSDDGRKYIEYWNGMRRILVTPCSDTDTYLAFTTLDTDRPGKTVPIDKSLWKKSFPHLRDHIDRVGEGGRWDLFETIHLKRWHEGRIAIIGDAGHAQAPNLGQGGGCGMMNALALAHYVSTCPTIESGLVDWEQRERPLIEHTQRVSSIYSRVAALPPRMQTVVLTMAGKSRWVLDQRLKAARHLPTGAEHEFR